MSRATVGARGDAGRGGPSAAGELSRASGGRRRLTSKGTQPLEHVDSLDGLRFLAAAVVVIGHSWNCLAKSPELDHAVRHGLLTIFINGYGAVHLFFILSGFCLAGSADRARNLADLAQFYTRRIFRIHPPYMYALLVAWLASFVYDTSRANGGLTDEALRAAGVHLSFRELLPYFRYPSDAANQLNPAWTLAIEMNFSFLLPIMLWLTRRTHWVVLVAASLYPLLDAAHTPAFLIYAFHFALGIAFYQERFRLQAWAGRVPVFAQAAIVAAGLGIFISPWLLDVVFRPDFSLRPLGIALSGTGGAVLLGAALFFPGVRAGLSSRALVWGGRRSYSFYLLHYPVMLLFLAIVRGPVGWFEGAAFISLVFATTLAAAAVSFAAVERPAIRAGNLVCAAIARRVAARAQVSRLS